ncbi:MAG: YqgE/AlgH family protein [Pseudomonadota bacterium]|nr:YqgE/AlgH family protein [Pseudomonadota bacterium]
MTGQLLVAMPATADPRFSRSVILVCSHSAEGAMGLVVNRALDTVSFPNLMKDLGVEASGKGFLPLVNFGGPVESGRGFVLHTADLLTEGSLRIDHDLALTTTLDILHRIAAGTGPKKSLFALGYAGWGPGQLEAEIVANGWLNVPADPDLVFDTNLETKWDRAVAQLGIGGSTLSMEAGNA